MSIRSFFKPKVTNVFKPINYEKRLQTNERTEEAQPILPEVQIPVETDPNLRSLDEIRILFKIK